MAKVPETPVTILNVDDHEISRYAKSRVLRQAGFEVKETNSGYETLQLVQQEHPPLVLLDVGLPDINGLEVCRRIKNNPEMALTLVLQISASLITSSDKARGLEGGADAYLVEPVEPTELVATVRALLRLRQAEAALENQHAFLRQVIDLNPSLIFAKDRQGRFTLVNQAVADVYGASIGALIGRTDADFSANPAEVAHFQHDDLEVMNSLQEKFIPEETITDVTGQTRWLQTVKRPIIGPDGQAHQILGVATDITMRKQAQAALTRLNETLEQRVHERTALIQLLQEISAAANESETVEAALQFALDRVCAYTGWPVGHVYWLNRENLAELISSSIWHLDSPERYEAFRRLSEVIRFAPGEGLPGQIWASGEVTWLADVTGGPDFPRAKQAAEVGLRAGFGFPLWVGQEIVAVLEFYSPETVEPEGAFLEAITQIGTQLGRVVERRRAHWRIRESERQLLEAQQIAHLGSWQWEVASNQVSWSDELYHIYGLPPQSVAIDFEGFLARVHPEDRDRVATLVTTAFETGLPFDFEHRIIRPNGTVRTLHAQGKVLLDDQGRSSKMVGTGHDITERKAMEEQLRRLNVELEQRVAKRTAQLEAANRELAEEINERKQAQQALQANETQLRLITNAAPALIAYVDNSQRYRFNNRAYETWFGQSPAKLHGRPVREVLGQAAYESLRPHMEAALAGQEVSFEQLTTYQTGASRYIQAHYIPDIDETGHVRGYVSLVNDITERRQIEDALRESEARFRMLADTAPVLIWMSAPDKHRNYFNKPWLDFTGRTIDQEVGFGWAEGVHPADQQYCLDTYHAAFDARQPFQMEYRLRRFDGEYRWIVDKAVPRFEGEQFVGYIGSVMDIHERKQAELAERFLAEAGKVLTSSLDATAQLSNIAWLAVPDLADWCAVDLYEDDWTVHHIATAHVDPAKVTLAGEVQRRYPPRREDLIKEDQPWQRGESQLFPEITEAMLEAGAQDAEHYEILRSLNLHSAMIVPLVAREQVLGIMAFFWAESGRHYNEEDLPLAEELARRAAIALDNAQAYEAEQKARQAAEQITERIAGIQAVTARLSGALTPDEVAQVILTYGVAAVEANGGAVVLLSHDETEFAIAGAVGYPDDIIASWQRFPATEGLPMSDVVRSGEPFFFENRQAGAALYPNLAETVNINHEAWVFVPLLSEQQALGVLSFSFAQVRTFVPEDREFILTLARQGTQALERAYLYEAEQQARQEAEASAERIASLQNITAAFSEALTSAEVTRVVMDYALPVLGATGGAVALLSEDGATLETVDYQGYPPEAVEQWRTYPVTAATPMSEAVRTRQSIFLGSVEEFTTHYFQFAGQRRTPYQAWAAVPLAVKDRVLGAIGLSFAQPQAFTLQDRAFLLALAQQCAQALERARLYEVEQQARAEAEANQQRLALLAEMRERNRLAQELHDTVAQALGYLNLKIGIADNMLANEDIEAAQINLRELKQVIGETYTDVREEIFNLRAKVLSGLGFTELLDRYIDKYRRFYNLDIQLIHEVDPAVFDFSAETTSQLVRTIQEALINIRKHAQVNQAVIRLGEENGQIRISIEDEGRGFEPAKIKEKTASFGLQIMRERVESVGGSLEINTVPDHGTRIILRYQK